MGALLLGFILAQSVPGEPRLADLDRIRRGLAAPAPVSITATPVRRDGAVFRMKVESFKLESPWTDRSIVPRWIRSVFPPVHYEFLERVTAEEFRSGTLYPGALGVPVIPIVEFVGKHVAAARRVSKQKRAREDVRKALADFLACQADPSKAGCSDR